MQIKMIRLIGLLTSAMLGGCANFGSISQFASEGNKVSVLVKADFESVQLACKQIAKRDVILKALDKGYPGVTACDSINSVLPKMAATSIDILNTYHETLGKLANDKNWSLNTDIDGIAKGLGGIKGGDGEPVIAETEKMKSVVKAIADAAVSVAREQSARKLLDEKLPWDDTLRPLRVWFGAQDSLSTLRGFNGSVNTCTVITSSLDNMSKRMDSVYKTSEPLRAQEWIAEIEMEKKPLLTCADRSKAVVAAVDAWLLANAELQTNAFKADAQTLWASLQKLKDKRTELANAFTAKQ